MRTIAHIERDIAEIKASLEHTARCWSGYEKDLARYERELADRRDEVTLAKALREFATALETGTAHVMGRERVYSWDGPRTHLEAMSNAATVVRLDISGLL